MRRPRLSVRTSLVATAAALAAGGVGIATGAVNSEDPRLPANHTDVGDLGLRVPEAASARIATLDAFMTAFIIQGSASQADEKAVALTVSDGGTRRLRVTVGQSGISQGDFAPRSDGARRYTLYGETAGIAQP